MVALSFDGALLLNPEKLLSLCFQVYRITDIVFLETDTGRELHSRLLVVLGLEDFCATHGTNAFFVRAVLAILGVGLVDLGLADATLFKLVPCKRVEPGFFLRRKQFVLADFSASVFCLVARSRFPLVGNDHLKEENGRSILIFSALAMKNVLYVFFTLTLFNLPFFSHFSQTIF